MTNVKELVTARLVALHDRRLAGSKQAVVGTMAERFLDAITRK